MFQLKDYQTMAAQYRQSSTETERNLIIYPAMALAGEAGEVANEVKKFMRRDIPLSVLRQRSVLEIGDVLWYCAALATDLNLSLDLVAHENIAKLDQTYGLEAAGKKGQK